MRKRFINMNNENLIKELTDLLSFHAISTKNLTLNGLNDRATLSEDLYMNIANHIFGAKFKNANSLKKNHEAIDLYDEECSIAIQVTIRTDSQKIKSTISKFTKNNYQLKYKKLYFIIIDGGKKENYFRKNEFDTKKKIDFSVKDNILLISDIIERAKYLDLTILASLVSEVKKYIQLPKEESLNKKEIEKLWTHISSLSECIKIALEPDPTETRSFSIEQGTEESVLAINKLLSFYKCKKIYFDEGIIKVANEIIENASNIIDFTRVLAESKKTKKPADFIDDWVVATRKKNEFTMLVSNIEDKIRKKISKLE